MEQVRTLQEKVKSLASVSPSRFSSLKACALREVWSASGNNMMLPLSPKARIGSITHQLLAEAGRGQLHPDRDAVESRWVEMVNHAQIMMQQSPIEKHLVPLERSVPDMQVRHIRAVENALAIARDNRGLVSSPTTGPASNYGFEIPVKSADVLVRGIIDCVLPTQDGPLIRDYKSGELFAHDELHEREVKEEYVVQLKMYAALYADTFGQWPVKLQVVPLSGSPVDITFGHEECSDLVRQASGLLQRINKTIASELGEHVVESLAHPNPTSCSFCPYRPACKSCRIAIKTPEEGWPLDIWGTIQELKQLGNSRFLLRVVTRDGAANIPGLSPNGRHPALRAMAAGDDVAVFNLGRSKSNDSYNETPLTTIYKTAHGQILD